MLRQAGQVASVEVAAEWTLGARRGGSLVGAAVALGQLLPALHQDRVAVDVAVPIAFRAGGPRDGVGRRVVRRIAVGKSIGEDLVDGCTGGPRRGAEFRLVGDDLPAAIRRT